MLPKYALMLQMTDPELSTAWKNWRCRPHTN